MHCSPCRRRRSPKGTASTVAFVLVSLAAASSVAASLWRHREADAAAAADGVGSLVAAALVFVEVCFVISTSVVIALDGIAGGWSSVDIRGAGMAMVASGAFLLAAVAAATGAATIFTSRGAPPIWWTRIDLVVQVWALIVVLGVAAILS